MRGAATPEGTTGGSMEEVARTAGRFLKDSMTEGELRNDLQYKVLFGRGTGAYRLYCGERYATPNQCRCGHCEGVCGPYTGCPCIFCLELYRSFLDTIAQGYSKKAGVSLEKVKKDRGLLTTLWRRTVDCTMDYCETQAKGEPSNVIVESSGTSSRWLESWTKIGAFRRASLQKADSAMKALSGTMVVVAFFIWIGCHLFFSLPLLYHVAATFCIAVLVPSYATLATCVFWLGSVHYARHLNVALQEVEDPGVAVTVSAHEIVRADQTLFHLISDPDVDRESALSLDQLKSALWHEALEERMEALILNLAQKYLDSACASQFVVRSIKISKLRLGGNAPIFRDIQIRRLSNRGPGRDVLIVDIDNEFRPTSGSMRTETDVLFNTMFNNAVKVIVKDVTMRWRASIVLPTCKEPPFVQGQRVKLLLTSVPKVSFKLAGKLGDRDVNFASILPHLQFMQDSAVNATLERLLVGRLPYVLVDSIVGDAHDDIPARIFAAAVLGHDA